MLVPLKVFVVRVASAYLVVTASRLSPKSSPGLALVAAAAVAPVPPVRADHPNHGGPWSETCGGCTFSGNYDGAPLTRTGSCATDCTNLDLSNRAITSMPGDPFVDMGALERLDLQNNELTSLETGIFDALTSLWYLRTRMGACACAVVYTHGVEAPLSLHAGEPRTDGSMIVFSGRFLCKPTP